jgi:hypothetical protein
MKKWRLVLLGLGLLFLFRGFVFRLLVCYTVAGERENIELIHSRTILEIDSLQMDIALDLKGVVGIAGEITDKRLLFYTENVSSDPNVVAEKGKANCIGYAALFQAAGEYILKNKNLKSRYEIKHLIGKMQLLGWDLHAVFSSPFFRDHDFNVILDKETGETLYFDPSLHDYLGIGRVRCCSK